MDLLIISLIWTAVASVPVWLLSRKRREASALRRSLAHMTYLRDEAEEGWEEDARQVDATYEDAQNEIARLRALTNTQAVNNRREADEVAEVNRVNARLVEEIARLREWRITPVQIATLLVVDDRALPTESRRWPGVNLRAVQARIAHPSSRIDQTSLSRGQATGRIEKAITALAVRE